MLKKVFSAFSSSSTPADVSQVKKNTVTADSIISETVKKAGNLSSVTLTKEEQKRLLQKQQQIPPAILALKYISIVIFALSMAFTIFIVVESDPDNTYLGILGNVDNHGIKAKKLKEENVALKQKSNLLTKSIEDYKYRLEHKKYGQFTDITEKILAKQKPWFTQSTVTIDPKTGEKHIETTYGILDSFELMASYFQDSLNYRTKYFALKDQKLLGEKYKECRNPMLSPQEKVRLGCPKTSLKLAMRNEIQIENINVNESGITASVKVNELLSKVFTLGSEFSDMMNSFSFLKNGKVNTFNRSISPTGEESMNLALRLEFQGKEEKDAYDEYFPIFEEWYHNTKIHTQSASTITSSSESKKPKTKPSFTP